MSHSLSKKVEYMGKGGIQMSIGEGHRHQVIAKDWVIDRDIGLRVEKGWERLRKGWRSAYDTVHKV